MTWDAKTLSHDEARRVYDRIGRGQDTQAFYEDVATGELIRHLEPSRAQAVFEFGCGTGRFAARLLAAHLPPAATYRACDLSPVMVKLAERRLAPFAPRAVVALSDGRPPVGEVAGGCDRFVSNFVFDLLSRADAEAVVREAHRMLRPGGLLGLCGLAGATTPSARALGAVWSFVHALRPQLVGGCRPVEVEALLTPDRWRIRHAARRARFALPMEVVVAERIEPGRPGVP